MFSFLKKAFASALPPKEIRVSLEEISSIWLRHNQMFQEQKHEDAETTVGIDGATESTPKNTEQAIGAATAAPPPPVKIDPTAKVKSTAFYTDLVEPYKNMFEQQRSLDGIYKLIALLEEQGNCPSIVTAGSDAEAADMYSIADILKRVTLKEHSFLVAKIALRLLKDTYRDHESLIPQTVVAALGHDIGKIPALRIGPYVKEDHPVMSAAKINELFGSGDIFWLNRVIEAIKDHHRQSNDQFVSLLKAADSKAREIEVSENSKDLVSKEWDEWFDPKALLAAIEPQVNVIQTGNKWKAFSSGDIVYCQPDFIYEETKQLAANNRIIDMSLLKMADKEIALKKIVDSLKRTDAVNSIGDGFYGRFFDVQMEKAKRKMMLVPLRMEAFINPAEIERAKESHPPIFKGITPTQK